MTFSSNVKVCIFDAYGTLFDFAAAAESSPSVPSEKRAVLTALWREKQIQYTFLRTLQGRYVNFEAVTEHALEFALEAVGLASPERHAELMSLYKKLDAFPEVSGVLERLKVAGFRTAILSNGTPDMLASVVQAAGIATYLDRVLSVDAVRAFKTNPKTYRYALDEFGVSVAEAVFVSSNGWDAWAASDFGLNVVWCNRYDATRERLPGAPDYEIRSLIELPALLGIY